METGIKLYQQNIELSRYPKREADIYSALQTRLISSLEEKELYNILKSNISKSYATANFTAPEPNQFMLIVDETMKYYRDRFGFIREAEINLIFTRGLAKEYGPFMGLSFITFVDWAKAYAKDLVRIKLTSAPKETNKPTDEEMYQLKKTNALSALNEFKAKGTCGRYALDVYDFFCELKLIDLSQEEKNEYWRLAKQEYQQYLNSQRAKMITMEDKRKLDKEYAEALEGGKTARFVVISKRLIVDDYFRTIVMEETDLLTLIEQK